MRALRQAGFTYLGLLAAIVILGLLLTMATRVWSLTEQRERETQLLFIGHQFRMAVARYYAAGRHYPPRIEELLGDPQSPVPLRYLRQLYRDPMTGERDWLLIRDSTGVGIMGIASRSSAAPIKRDGFTLIDQSFKDAECYCAWQFIYYPNRFHRGIPGVPTTVAPGAPSAPSAPPALLQQTPDAPSGGSTP